MSNDQNRHFEFQSRARRAITNTRASQRNMDGRAVMDAAASPDPVPWMDADETAAALGSTAHTMRRLAREGRSPALVRRIGGRWRWSRADVDRFVRGEPDSAA